MYVACGLLPDSVALVLTNRLTVVYLIAVAVATTTVFLNCLLPRLACCV